MIESNPYQIGRYYQVPTVLGTLANCRWDWPVIGPLHEDAEIIGFPDLHYHIDWRFVSARLYVRMVDWYGFSKYGASHLLALPLHQGLRAHQIELPKPVIKRLMCKRDFPAYPRISWLNQLEEKYQDCVLKTAVCPHRGIALDNLPCNEDGIVTCPGHGLQWNLRTGKIVTGQHREVSA
jgi:hypothetical protein